MIRSRDRVDICPTPNAQLSGYRKAMYGPSEIAGESETVIHRVALPTGKGS